MPRNTMSLLQLVALTSMVCLGLALWHSCGREAHTDEANDTLNNPLVTGQACKVDPTGFEKIEVGMSYDAIVNIVGKPTTELPTGRHIVVYELHPRGGFLLAFDYLDKLDSIAGFYVDESGKEHSIEKKSRDE